MKYLKPSPSVLFLITLIIGLFLSWVQPWHLTLYLEYTVAQSIGLVLLFISLILNTLAYREFKKSHTPHAPFMKPKVLIKYGVFSISRNPVYLALVMSQCALGFIFDMVWLIFSACLLLLILHHLIIPHEEQILERIFTDDYLNYKEHTRRWL